jgi:excisionase family DNA binding protein
MSVPENIRPKKSRTIQINPDVESDVDTVPGAAHRLLTSTRSIWRLIGKGELKTVRVGRSVKVTRASIAEFIEKGGAR